MKKLGLLLVTVLLFAGAQAKEQINPSDSVKQEAVVQTEGISQSAKDSILLQKLSPDQLAELEKARLDVETQRIASESHSDMPLSSTAIVLICLLPFLFVVAVLVVLANSRNRESKRKYELYMKSLEMGQTIPENFFDEPKKSNPNSNLKKGILWFVVGAALLIYFVIVNQKDGLIVGIVPTFVGIGYLLVHKLDKPKTEITINSDEQNG